MPFFSIIMQSTLRQYAGAATNRDLKLLRAVESVKAQTFTDWELIIVADKCRETSTIIRTSEPDIRIRLIESFTEVEGKWFSHCRNLGADEAEGNYILYLDNDDTYHPDYLQRLKTEIDADNLDWYVVDHFEFKSGRWDQVRCNIKPNSAGTANIIHSRQCRSRWPDRGHYGSEDWTFIRQLMSEGRPGRQLYIAGYQVCHIRGRYDL